MLFAAPLGFGLMVILGFVFVMRTRCRQCGHWGFVDELIRRDVTTETSIERDYTAETPDKFEVIFRKDFTYERSRHTCPRCGHVFDAEILVKIEDGKSDFLIMMYRYMIHAAGLFVTVYYGRMISHELVATVLPRLLAFPISLVGWAVQLVVVAFVYAALSGDRSTGSWKWGLLTLAWLPVLASTFDPAMNRTPSTSIQPTAPRAGKNELRPMPLPEKTSPR